ncbi:MAG: aldo/keto reductase [Spirulinaceae cyanobacterium]
MKENQNLISDSLIVGCWQLDNRSWQAITEEEIERTIDTYLAMGISSFDTADIYGRSEKTLGQVLQGRDCTILTKAVFFGEIPNTNQIKSKVESSLRKLKKESLDCLQIYWHNPQLDCGSTFTTFNELLEAGKIRQLGVTNFDTPMLEKALQYAPIKTNQIQYSLIDRRAEKSLQPFCLEKDVTLLPYGPLAGGYLSRKFLGIDLPSTEGEHARSFYYSSMIRAHGGWSPVQEMLLTMAQMGNKYKVSISQLALNWVKNQPGVGAVISGFTQNRQQIKSNIEAMEVNIAPEDLQLLSERSDALFKQEGDIYSYEKGDMK